MAQVILFLVRSLGLLTLLFSAVFGLHASSSFSLIFTFTLAGLLFVISLSVGLRLISFFGFLVVISPVLGGGALHLLAAAYLFGHTIGSLFDETKRREEDNASKELLLLATACFVTAFLCPVFIPFYIELDPTLLGEVFQYGGVAGFYRFWSSSPLTSARALHTLNGYLLIGCLVGALCTEDEIGKTVRRFFKGIGWGFLLSLIFLAAQRHGRPEIFQGNYSEYWKIAKQYPAASTDPNGLGVSLALALPLLLTYLRGRLILRSLMFSVVLILGLYSGSRTFILGLLLLSVGFLYQFVKRLGRKELSLAFVVGTVGLIFALILFGNPTVNESLQRAVPFPASIRVLKTLNWNERESMFSSRIIFSRVAIKAWKESPIVGLGLERFYDRQKAAMESLGIDLGGWVDNANNFYLQLLSECGLFGMSLVLLAFSLIIFILTSPYSEDEPEELKEVKPEQVRDHRVTPLIKHYPSLRVQSSARLAVLAFAILLITGPHLLLPEVQAIFAVAITAACIRPVLIRKVVLGQIRAGTVSALFLFTLGFIVFAGVMFTPSKTRGFYPPDSALHPYMKWSGGKGKIVLCGNESDTVQFRFRSLRPNLAKHPVSVTFHEGEVDIGDTTQNFELTNNEWTTVIVPLRPDENGKFSQAVVSFRVSPLWSPRAASIGDDPRFLGIQVDLPKRSC